MNQDTKEITEHVTSVFEKLKASGKLGLIVAVGVIAIFIVASTLMHSHGAG